MKVVLIIAGSLFLAEATHLNADSYTKQKGEFFPGASITTDGPDQFQLSLLPCTRITHVMPNLQLLAGLPALGHYALPYNFRTRIAVIELNPEDVKSVASQAIRTALGASFDSCSLSSFVMITGVAQDLKRAPATGIYNILFHPVVAAWEDKQRFNIHTWMGLFSPDGVQQTGSGGIRFNGLSQQSVHVHASRDRLDAASPNNARFQVSADRAVSTFWTVAQSPDKGKCIITFHILINSPALHNEISNTTAQAQNLEEFLMGLQSITGLHTTDDRVLDEAVTTIHELVTGVPLASPVPEEQSLAEALMYLQEQLRELEQALQQ